MALVEQNLRRQVLWSSTQSVGPGLYNFGKAEVGQLEIAVLSKKQVFWFEVSEDDVLIMEMLEDKDNLGSIQAE